MSYEVNTSLVLETIDTEHKKVYKARIADIKSDSLFLEMPMNEETKRIEAPMQGTKLRVWYQTKDGAKANFDTEVTGRYRDNIAMLIVAKPDPSSIQKNQRRDFIRMPAHVEVSLEIIKKDLTKERVLCKSEDLSGGGFSVKFNRDIKITEGQKIKFWMVLPKKNKVIHHSHGEGEVVRVIYPVVDNPKALAWASFKFSKILESERSKVIQYTFERQIELHGK
ncbi:hypothetical protein BHU72_08035 [Desulfuribacillus stibiiarsenatis]|uniref:Pilus assembly protein PilZ n=1 Tax=Desulfuribacillus stibiiarsenatis TaxID=1390249 RepID=A0A1E5L428_9FIRM|nr:flagellar brake domain-containing protein [Desulfuribacillus stibiiarsenatis]OEH84773.1 hypothetical protein BHU72_08035 [Desulfuribacillus stibiiarsenatis]